MLTLTSRASRHLVSALAVGLVAALTACSDDTSGATGGGGTGGTGTTGQGGTGGAGGAGSGGMAPDPIWGCVGSVEWPTPTASQASLTVHANVLTDLLNSAPLDGATITLCSLDDPTCAGITYPITGGSGTYAGTVPLDGAPFEGFLLIQHPTAPDYYLRLAPPISGDRVDDLLVDSYTSLGQLADEAGASLDPSRGTVWLNVRDCRWSLETGEAGQAPGVQVALDTADASTVVAYLDADGVHIDPTLDETSASGLAVAFNVPVGTTTAEGRRVSDAELIGKVSMPVHPDAESVIMLAPTPDLPPLP